MGPDAQGAITPGNRCIMAQDQVGQEFSATCVDMACSDSGEVLVGGSACNPGAHLEGSVQYSLAFTAS